MKSLSLYALVAVALMVCCLAPSEVFSKPVKKQNGHRPQEDRGSPHSDNHGRRKDGPVRGRGRDGTVDVEPTESTGPDDEEDEDNQSDSVSDGGLSDSIGQDEASLDGQTGPGGNDGADGETNFNTLDNSTTRDPYDRRGNMPIRPRYKPNDFKPKSGPLGLKGKSDKEHQKMRKAVGYMSQFGYMGKTDDDDWTTEKMSTKKMKKSIRMMQKFMGLKATGELDEMTMMMMDKPRCGVADVATAPEKENGTASNQTGPQSYSHFGQRWDKTEITFRILNYPSTMPPEETREALLRAFQVWSDITPLTFREVFGAVYADFYLKFGARDHGDSFPFDGRHGTLAHAFLPKSNSGDIEGDVHFDDDELFTYASYEGTNLFQVAAHEIGHSLGMHHSFDNTALMAPFYPGYQPTFYLPYDDLSGIQSLYGSKPNPLPYPYPYPNPAQNEPTQAPKPATTPAQPNPATTTAQPNPATTTAQPNPEPTQPATTPGTGPVNPCPPVLFDAVTRWRTELFSFTGNKYGRIRDYNILSNDGGSDARYFFRNFPGDIDAVYEEPITYRLLMFKGPNYYVYNGLMQESGPNPITSLDPSLPSDIDAVVTWAAYQKTYFFKGELVWRFDEVRKTVDGGWPHRIDRAWRGVPNGVTAAFHDEDRHLTYFLAGNDYYRYDDLYAEVDVGPRDFTGDFFGCF